MNVKDIVAAKKKEREDEQKEKQLRADKEREDNLNKDTDEWIRRFKSENFDENTPPEKVAEIYMTYNRISMYCPSLWISSSWGSESAHYPQAVWDMIKKLNNKFGIKLNIRDRTTTRYCGSIPQDTVQGILLWIEME